MAKKENKFIGYAVLSIIPLLGIIWAFVAGMQHTKYVNDVKKVELNFEKEVNTYFNSLGQNSKGENYPTINEELNLTSILPRKYSSHLMGDNFSGNSSYAITLGFNPERENVAKKDESGQIIKDEYGNEVYESVLKFKMIYEFFIDSDTYTNFSEYFDRDCFSLVGENEFTYLTYYKNNPRHAPINALTDIFKNNYKNVHTYVYNGTTYEGVSYQSVIDLINDLGEITVNSKKQLDLIKTTISLLNEEDITLISNYDVYQEALLTYDVKVVENTIDKLPKLENLKSTDYFKINKAKQSLATLSVEQQAKVNNIDTLNQLYNKVMALQYIDYKLNDTLLDEKGNEKPYTDEQIKALVDEYNKLTGEQKAFIDDKSMNLLKAKVEEYNNKHQDNKLVLD